MKYNPARPFHLNLDGTDLFVFGFANKIFNSSTWVLGRHASSEIIIIDPGDSAQTYLQPWMVKNKKKPAAVILTHEHFDHCNGFGFMSARHSFELIATETCHRDAAYPERNHSKYAEEVEAFSVVADKPVKITGLNTKTIDGISLTFLPTPGHTPSGMCIICGDAVFTGDTLLNGVPSPLKFRNSSRKEYEISLELLKTHLRSGTTIFPGHGDAFTWNLSNS